MCSVLWLSVALLVAGVCGESDPYPAILEPFEPEPRVFSVLDLLTAINSRLKRQESRLDELTAGLAELRRRLPQFPGCEAVTVGDHQYRLIGDPDCRRGRVQWRLRGYYRWWHLCDRSELSPQDAAVVCRSLDFRAGGSTGVEGPLLVTRGQGRARTLHLGCQGTESHLRECHRGGSETRQTEGCPADAAPVTVTCHDG